MKARRPVVLTALVLAAAPAGAAEPAGFRRGAWFGEWVREEWVEPGVRVYLNGAQDQDGQKVLVLYTDGGDTRSSITFHETLDLLKASDVTVYAIGYLERERPPKLSLPATPEQTLLAIEAAFLPRSRRALSTASL